MPLLLDHWLFQRPFLQPSTFWGPGTAGKEEPSFQVQSPSWPSRAPPVHYDKCPRPSPPVATPSPTFVTKAVGETGGSREGVRFNPSPGRRRAVLPSLEGEEGPCSQMQRRSRNTTGGAMHGGAVMEDSRNSPARDPARAAVSAQGQGRLSFLSHPAVASRGLRTFSVSLAQQKQTMRESVNRAPEEEKSWAAGSRGPSYDWADFVHQAETDLQHLRKEFQGKKEIISEVRAAVSTVQASLAEQSLSVQNLRQGVGEALQEMEALQLAMQVEQTQDTALWPQDRHVSTPAPIPETVLLELVGRGISWLWGKRGGFGQLLRRAQWLGSRLLLLFGVSWTAFYILIVQPALLEGLIPPLLSKGTVWRVRGFFTPFLRLEVDDLLPF
ncbi:coiled-coil domain-containing protein 188 [Tachyglossus aculeatus]|uniref:coiled-coil domain-containing protein 188 n=1 Tax=Tachyglossus aculeatus TaxID=9261 RepID=UPI0018F2E778|nr:coiled-coil domain-containing protein 188 [Tachyglossus aculeatus]